jgi:hypothetical protein
VLARLPSRSASLLRSDPFPLTRQAELAEENRRLKEENARLVDENDALRRRVQGLEDLAGGRMDRKEAQDSWQRVDAEVWRQVEDAKAGVEIALRQLEGLHALRSVTRHTPESASPPDGRIETEIHGDRHGEQVIVTTKRCCVTTPMASRPVESACSTGPGAADECSRATPTLDSIALHSSNPTTTVDVDLPSFHLGYPQSNEREECCLGLISCEPSAIEQ